MTPEKIAELKKTAETASANLQAAESDGAAPEVIADLKKKAETASAELKTAESAPPQDPVKAALEQARKNKRPEIDRAAHSLKKNAERLKELGGDPAKVLGDVIPPDNDLDDGSDDDKPVTRGELKKMQAEQAQKTSMQLADSIENEDERELAKEYLRTTIRPSGDPEQDLSAAMALVNSVKNRQVAEEITRRATTPVRRFGSGSGSPQREKTKFEASPEELAAAKIAHVKPENMETWILARREGKPIVFGTAAKKQREAEAARR